MYVYLCLLFLSLYLYCLSILFIIYGLSLYYRMLDPRVIGDTHYFTARATQKLLQV